MMHVVSVRDAAVDAFMNPFVVPAPGAAIRSFRDEINRSAADNAMNKHASDYDLYVIGTFSEQDGVITPEPPRLLIRGKDCLIASS